MKEIRDIKIDLLMGNQNPIIEWFKEMTKDLRIIKCDVYNKDGLEFKAAGGRGAHARCGHADVSQ